MSTSYIRRRHESSSRRLWLAVQADYTLTAEDSCCISLPKAYNFSQLGAQSLSDSVDYEFRVWSRQPTQGAVCGHIM
jgi:hypothetical protein